MGGGSGAHAEGPLNGQTWVSRAVQLPDADKDSWPCLSGTGWPP